MSGLPVIVVQDAYRLLPDAEVLYGCEPKWWRHHQGCQHFRGEKWSTHEWIVSPRIVDNKPEVHTNDKTEAHEQWGVKCVKGRDTGKGFSFDPSVINYGSNSGFQAINLAILFGCVHIILVGFDMRHVDGKAHWFGDHAEPLRTCPNYAEFLPDFNRAAKFLPPHIKIVNATPGSALKCFPMMTFDEAIRDNRLHCNRPESNQATG